MKALRVQPQVQPRKEPSPFAIEMAAMEAIGELLDRLDDPARQRLIRWAADYAGIAAPPPQPPAPRPPSDFDLGTFDDVVRAARRNAGNDDE